MLLYMMTGGVVALNTGVNKGNSSHVDTRKKSPSPLSVFEDQIQWKAVESCDKFHSSTAS